MLTRMNKGMAATMAICLVLITIPFSTAYADKSSVRIEAPESAAPGSEITITLHVSHDGNNFMHYTEWVYLKIDGEEVARWSFGGFSKPESDNFTRTFPYAFRKPIEIQAEASCNIHGSTGVSTAKVASK
ncbi:MAG: desulfoferrodoxin family protein [Thermodesulfobacteriota bacterium]